MASINPEFTAIAVELKSDSKSSSTRLTNFLVIDVVLRVLLFATSLASVVVLLTGKQTEMIPIPFPPYGASVSAEFTDSPAFVYSLVALSVACLYSIITTLLSFSAFMKRDVKTANLVANVFVIDVLLLGIVASAAGAAGEVAYIGMKGNTNTGWHKICNVYGSFCRNIGLSVLSSIFASIVLSFLIILQIVTISRKHHHWDF